MTDLVSQETSDRGAELVAQDQPDELSNELLDVSQFVGSPASPKLPMKAKRQKKVRDLYSEQPVLRTESKDDFAMLLAEISQDIGPKSFIVKTLVTDVAYHTWEIMRYRRIKTGILNNALKAAVERIVRQMLFPPSLHEPMKFLMAPKTIAHDWLSDPETKRCVYSMLQEAGTDESAIEAEAYRLVADDLERVNKILNAEEEGRDKALNSIAKHRKGFGDQLRRSSDRMIAADEVRNTVNDAEN